MVVKRNIIIWSLMILMFTLIGLGVYGSFIENINLVFLLIPGSLVGAIGAKLCHKWEM